MCELRLEMEKFLDEGPSFENKKVMSFLPMTSGLHHSGLRYQKASLGSPLAIVFSHHLQVEPIVVR
jgi:hypothetical protein